jgi:hypothetical protein
VWKDIHYWNLLLLHGILGGIIYQQPALTASTANTRTHTNQAKKEEEKDLSTFGL